MRHVTSAAAAALVLAACAGEPTGLVPLSRADIETLDPGAGCSLERGGDTLLVAMTENGAAVARTADGLVNLTYEGEELFDGGRFAPDGRGPVIEVAPAGEETAHDYTTARDAVLSVDGRPHPEPGEWVCGA